MVELQPSKLTTWVRFPSSAPFYSLWHSQVVRHQTLTLTFRWFDPSCHSHIYDSLAQMVEHLTFNQRVGGSNPPRVTILVFYLTLLNTQCFIFGGLAQLGEHLPYKQGVTGSSPVTSTI